MNSLHGVCIEYASKQRFSNQNTISTDMLPVFLTCKEQSREVQATRHLYETRREIYSTQLKLRKKTLFCKSTEKYVHCYPAYTAAFSRMNYCRSTVVTTYLSCLVVRGW